MDIRRYDAKTLQELLPFPAPDANKYIRGEAVVVGGSGRYPGAAALASHAASRMGAGYVRVFCDLEAIDVVRGFDPTLVVQPWEEFGRFANENKAKERHHPLALLAGSGMEGRAAYEEHLVTIALRTANVPLVIDGTGISYLATTASIRHLGGRTAPLVVTPHYGEAERMARALRLADIPAADAPEQNLAAFAKALADGYNATVTLKGPVTFIASHDADDVIKMDEGTSALAKAGTGDVLAGMTVALLAQGLCAQDAAVLAATLHAHAGAAAAKELTPMCVDAATVIDFLPVAIRQL